MQVFLQSNSFHCRHKESGHKGGLREAHDMRIVYTAVSQMATVVWAK